MKYKKNVLILQYEYSNAVEEDIESKLDTTSVFPFTVTLNNSAVQTPTDLYQYSMYITVTVYFNFIRVTQGYQ